MGPFFACGIEEIRRLGFVPTYDDSVFARTSYVAGPATLRATAIRAAWRDPAIAGIICARGGYGSAQLLPLLDPAEARAARKPFIGYSDLTALLTFHTITCDMVAFHGPTLAGRLGRGTAGYDRDSLERALLTAEPMGELSADGVESVRDGEAAGPLLGGILSDLLGFRATFAVTSAILLVASVGVRAMG